MKRNRRMKNRLARQVRRVGVTDPIAAARRYDYADAFEVRLPEPDPYRPKRGSARGWTPRRPGSSGSPATRGTASARIVESDADLVVLEDSDPLMDTVLVGATSSRRAGCSRPSCATGGRCSRGRSGC